MNDPRNPYAPPTTNVADQEPSSIPTDAGQFIPYGRSLPAGRGAGWIGDAWRMLRARPGNWALALILLFIAYIIVSMIPFVNILVQLMVPFAYAGIALVGDEQRRTGSFEIATLWGGFNKNPTSLLAVGGIVILAYLVIAIVVGVFIGMEVFGAMMGGAKTPDPSVFLSAKFFVVILVCVALMIPVAFASYLAPQLIVLHDQPAVTAMKMSLAGCLKNILPGLVFLICGILLVIASMIPLFLGLLISIPIMVITNYTVYRDIFVEENP
jgi:hypothetical protein